MKKIMIGLFAFSSMVTFADTGVNVYGKVGANLFSNFSRVKIDVEDFSSKKKGDISPVIQLEVTKNMTKNFELGLGLGYIHHRSNERFSYLDSGKKGYFEYSRYDSVPFYGIAKYNFDVSSDIRPYIKGDLGYSFNGKIKIKDFYDGVEEGESKFDVKNGVYFGIGAGVEYRNFVAELAYVHTNAKIKDTDDGESFSYKYNNDAIRLSVGYKFSF